jgi:hypothetical protein
MNNLSAFPQPNHPPTWTGGEGMTLRDYFAAKVLPQCFEVSTTTDIAAKEAYRMADAMMKAREQ